VSRFTEETSINLKRMKQLYFVPLDLRNLFQELIEIRQALPDHLSAIADAFEHNIRSVSETISLPFELASSNAQNRHWQRFSTAERIRSETIDPEPDEIPEAFASRKAEVATEIASKHMKEFLSSEDGIDAITNDIAEFLLSAHDRGTISIAASELIFQGTILTWSSFEVLARDVFINVINKHPNLVSLLLQDQNTKKRFDITKIPLDILSEHGFDVSNKMGSILAVQQDLSDLRTIKQIFLTLWGSEKNICDNLNNRALWILSQQRHLIVHKRGIVDADYNTKTGAGLPCGSRLQILPQDLEQYIRVVLGTGCSILRALSA